MKKKLFIAAVLLCFAVTLALSVYASSADNLSNAANGYEELVFGTESVGLINWNGENGSYTSGEDPQIIIETPKCYVHTVKLSGTLITDSDTVEVFYTESPGEGFSEEKRFRAPYRVSGGSLYFNVDKEVCALRIDAAEHTGAELILKSVVINDRSLMFSINGAAGYCVLPTALFGAFLFFILKRKELVPYFATLKKYIPLLKNLISRDLKVKYRRSVLGFLWSILNPLLMALVLNIVFSKLFRFQIEYFATYYLVGSLIFNFVTECTSGSMTSVLSAAPLIKKVYIPKYIFPLQKCVFAFINMLFGSVAVLVVMLIQGVRFRPTILLFFVPMITAFVFAYGFSLVLAAFTVFFRDIEHLYSVWTSIWMYLTPIIYPEDLLVSNGLSVVMKLNPMYYYVHSLRSVVMYGQLPTLSDNVMCAAFAVVMLIFGLAVFRKLQDRFILYI